MSNEKEKTAVNAPAILYDYYEGTPIAKIELNGYAIRPGGPVHANGAMRSFKLVDGKMKLLNQYWARQELLRLRINQHDLSVRISALPVETDASGFVEFVLP